MEYRYTLRIGHSCLEAWSTLRLPFEPKNGLDFRADLRRALLALRPVPAGHLHAVYWAAASRQLVDTENVLLYNVGSASLRHLMGGASRSNVSSTFPRRRPPQDRSSGRTEDTAIGVPDGSAGCDPLWYLTPPMAST